MRVIAAVVGLACGHVACANTSCALERVQDHVFGTSHFETPKLADADACCSACAALPLKCKAYTYASDTHICYLKDNAVGDSTEAHRVSGRAAPPAPASCTVQKGIEYLGNDVGTPKAVADEAACCTSCAADRSCKFFTYAGPGPNGLCHLKNMDAPDYSKPNASCTRCTNAHALAHTHIRR